MLLVEGSNYFKVWKMKNVTVVGMGRNQGVSLESGGLVTRFMICSMYEGDKVCLHCEQLIAFVSSTECIKHVAVRYSARWMCKEIIMRCETMQWL